MHKLRRFFDRRHNDSPRTRGSVSPGTTIDSAPLILARKSFCPAARCLLCERKNQSYNTSWRCTVSESSTKNDSVFAPLLGGSYRFDSSPRIVCAGQIQINRTLCKLLCHFCRSEYTRESLLANGATEHFFFYCHSLACHNIVDSYGEDKNDFTRRGDFYRASFRGARKNYLPRLFHRKLI